MFTTGLKKTAQNLELDYRFLELDKMYWFVGKKPQTETRENTYIMTMVSRLPRKRVCCSTYPACVYTKIYNLKLRKF